MRAGILIIGSLLWENSAERKSWRRSRLLIDDAIHVETPIRFGRRSQTRGNTFTMTFDPEERAGRAVLVPCQTAMANASALVAEAEQLWKAEKLSAEPGSVGASWGCVGVRFRNDRPPTGWAPAWASHFHSSASAIPPVDSNGFLRIPWPQAAVDIDVILATATKSEMKLPGPGDVAAAWIEQNQRYERYFFENVSHGIRTPDDALIWKWIEEEMPEWLGGNAYGKAVAILRGESHSDV